MKIVLLAFFWSMSAGSSSVTYNYEFKSQKINMCIKIKNTNLELLDCDGLDNWEILYDHTSGQATINSGPKNWYIINRSARPETGVWAYIKGLFQTSKPSKSGNPTIGVHEHDPTDFILDKDITESKKISGVTIINDAEEKCLDIEKSKKRFNIILKKCSDDLSQKWDITRLKEVPNE